MNYFNLKLKQFLHVCINHRKRLFISLFLFSFIGLCLYFFRTSIFQSATITGPVAYWQFNEGYGLTTQDETSNNIDGTMGIGTGASAPSWITEDQCISGKCLRFDGSDDNISSTRTTAIEPATGLTVNAWVRSTDPTKTSNNAFVIDKYRTEFDEDSYYLYANWSTNATVFGVRLGSGGCEATVASGIWDGKWHLLTGYFDGTNVRLYVDGVQKGANASCSGTIAYNTSDLYIGNRGVLRNFFNGFIDEVKIYGYARTADQIKQDFTGVASAKGSSVVLGANDPGTLSDGLIGYWKMDESAWNQTDGEVQDSSGNGNVGVGTSGATTTSGKFGNSGYFDGTNDYVGFASSVDPVTGGNPRTISAWVYPTAQNAALVSWGNYATGQATELTTNGNGDIALQFYNASIVDDDGSSITNQWTHVVATCSGDTVSTCSLWKNGQLVETSTNTTIINTSTNGSLKFGLPVSGIANILKGKLDEVRIYNRALSQNEITQLYSWAPGPVAHWKMDEGNGTTSIQDSSGNNLVGNMTGFTNADWTSGKFDHSLNFDSSDNTISVNDNPLLDVNGFTLGGWIKLNTDFPSSSQGDEIMTRRQAFNYSLYNFMLQGKNSTGNRLSIHFGDGSTSVSTNYLSSPVLNKNVWYYFSALHDPDTDTLSLYINGILAASVPTGGITPYINGTQLLVFDINTSFNISLDDIKLYNYARTPGQIVEDMNAGHPAIGTPVGASVLQLDFDEGYGGTAHDVSPQGNNGTLGNIGTGNSAPLWTNDGKFGKALYFDGTNDYVKVTDADSLSLSNSTVSMFAWVKSPDISTTKTVIRKFDTDYVLATVSSKVWCEIETTSVNTGSTMSNDTWYHIGCTYDGTTLKSYLNGVEQGSTAATAGTDANGMLFIGGRTNDTSQYFKGYIDDVRIYPFALSADNVKTVMNQGEQHVMGAVSTESNGTSPSFSSSREYCVPGDTATCNGPVVEYKFDEGTGTSSLNNTSNNGTSGSLNGTMTESDWQQGKYGKGLHFDGADDYIDTNIASNTISGDITFSTWFYSHDAGNIADVAAGSVFTQTLMSQRRSLSGARIAMGLDNNRLSLYFNDGGGNTQTNGTTVLQPNRWYHGALTLSGTAVSLYLNGKLEATGTVNSLSSPNSNTFIIAATNATPQAAFDGLLDQTYIYNYARTQTQIAWEYNKGTPIAWYQFDETSGTTVYDASGNALHGSLGTGSSAPTITTSGRYNNALFFDGTNDYVTISDPGTSSMLDIGNSSPLTLMGWINPDTLPATSEWRTIVTKGYTDGTDDANYMLQIGKTVGNNYVISYCHVASGGGLHCYDANGPSGSLPFTTGTWQHIAATYTQGDGSSIKVYLNGQLVTGSWSSGTGNAAGTIQNKAIWIGADQYNGAGAIAERFDGKIDDVRIYNYALTAQQIKAAMNDGALNFQ